MTQINIREHVEATIPAQDITKLAESAKGSNELPSRIVTVVEAIHSGLTRNYTFYPADNLERSVESWTRPYEKPVIKNHDVHEEPLGRVLSAHFKQSNIAPDKHTIELELEITDPDTIKKVLDGRYKTLSIGGSTNSVTCSACGKDLVKEGYCGHMKGRTYEGKQAHWIIGEMSFDEISWVNVPADSNAQVVHKNTVKQAESTSTEGGMSEMDQQTQDILDQIDNLAGVTENAQTANEPATGQQTEGATTEGDETPPTPEGQQEGAEGGEGGEGGEGQQTEGNEGEEGPTLQEQLDAANERIATLEADNLTLAADKEALQESLTTSEGEVQTLKDEVARLQTSLDASEDENKGLVKQSTTLATYTHKVLAESVATIQVALGKVEEGAMEATMAELTKQTSRSLKEQMAALSKEKPVRIVQTIEHPSTTGGSEEFVESTSQKPKEMTLEKFAENISAALNRQFN